MDTLIEPRSARFLRALLREIPCRRETIFPPCRKTFPTAIAWSNAHICGDEHFASLMLHGAYRACDVSLDEVVLAALPPGALLHGGTYLLIVDGMLVGEQIDPRDPDPSATARLCFDGAAAVEISAECVLLARFGDAVWGHWLAELLPRAVIAETAHPGRFTFVVAGHTTEPGTEGRSFSRSVLESLAAYGIAPDRLLRLDSNRTYRFAKLFLTQGTWSAATLHPKVLELMRASLRQPVPAGPGKRVAFLRTDTATRSVFNAAQIIELLTDANFVMCEMGRLPFIEQVAAFRDAECIFGILGSGMTGLIYARDAVRLITAAPANWADFYFYSLIQARRGINAEIRANSVWNGEGLIRDAPLVIDPHSLAQTLEVIRSPLSALAPNGMMRVAGVELPRWLGPCVLEIDFSARGNAQAHLGDGWSVQEAQHIWSLGPHSSLTMPAPPPRDDYMLELRVAAFAVRPCLPFRQLSVTVNGFTLGDYRISEVVTIGIRLPLRSLDGFDKLHLAFATPVCPPANVLGVGSDERHLGIALLSLRIRIQPCEPATE